VRVTSKQVVERAWGIFEEHIRIPDVHLVIQAPNSRTLMPAHDPFPSLPRLSVEARNAPRYAEQVSPEQQYAETAEFEQQYAEMSEFEQQYAEMSEFEQQYAETSEYENPAQQYAETSQYAETPEPGTAETPEPGTAETPEPGTAETPELVIASGGAGTLTLASAVRRHPFLTVLPAILLLAAGIAVGAKKHPTYSATATINVGKSDIATQATPGYVQAAEALATTYSRLVMSQHVSIPAARTLHESSAVVGAALTSVPVPTEPTFTITATGSSPQAAVNLGNAAIHVLQRFVNRSATQQGGPSQLLALYERAQTHADQLQQTSNTLQARFVAQLPGVTQTQVTQARVSAQAAALQAQALSSQYLSLASTGTAPTLDVLINPTGSTSSDRKTNIEKYGIIGGAAGLLIGIALAAFVGSLGARRRTKRA
jgi:hypothetical protein